MSDRGTGSPARHAMTSAFGGSLSSIDANRKTVTESLVAAENGGRLSELVLGQRLEWMLRHGGLLVESRVKPFRGQRGAPSWTTHGR